MKHRKKQQVFDTMLDQLQLATARPGLTSEGAVRDLRENRAREIIDAMRDEDFPSQNEPQENSL